MKGHHVFIQLFNLKTQDCLFSTSIIFRIKGCCVYSLGANIQLFVLRHMSDVCAMVHACMYVYIIQILGIPVFL